MFKLGTFSAAGLVTFANVVAAFSIAAGLPLAAQSTALQHTQLATQTGNALQDCESSTNGSPYIPLDSWIYPAVTRLNALGYTQDVYLGMRPWTRLNLIHMLRDTSREIEDANLYGDSTADEAQNLYAVLLRELLPDIQDCTSPRGQARLESSYSLLRAITGTPLHDSYHLGSSIVNDYGRPFENGLNNYSGLSGYASAGRYLLYVRGEFQGAPSAAGYSTALAENLSTNVDLIYFINPATGLPYNQATIPRGPIPTTTVGRLMEAYLSVNVHNHEVSIGKHDQWLGPGEGSAMAWSNNAENIYAFQINRTEPLRVPLLSRVIGPIRYDFLVGSLKGHTQPNDPWVHAEKLSFKPTRDLEFGFERTVIWGGKDHEPITLHTFLRSFFSLDSVHTDIKNSPQDPGARFGALDFSYRLPFPRNWLTLYTDMEAHDTPSPIFAGHATYRPGLYLSHFPGVPKLDLRAEAVNTDSSHPSSVGGRYQYYESIQKQGYTNKGQLFGDWVGREDKGGQAWITYHLSGNEWLQLSLRTQKAAKDFIPGGTTLADLNFNVVKRVGRDFEINGTFTYERYKAPIYLPGTQTVTNTSIRLTWFPNRSISF
ncbi:capsule assembly Wzi family protein [Telmatobacter sp. DSM 110680]|uniref:Capsule assembly Wzi family protein n=1 Tax=Telmatobacter sp. DSM 110680 TaxID=3036704 RepID=A0AAU7DHH3_9BACT